MDILKLLNKNDFSFSKRFGQNFILDTNLLSAIVSDAGINENDIVIEVGTGAGTLTREIAKKAKRVIGFEIDKRLEPVLKETLSDADNVEIVYSDVLKYTYEQISMLTDGGKYKVAANLPYYITTPVIFYFLADENCESLTVMVQKEVGERLTAKANTENYGAITVQVKSCSEPIITRQVSRNMFMPVPNVDSCIVRMDIKKKQGAEDYKLLKRLIACGFEMRRKTLANNMVKSFGISRETAVKLIEENGFNSGIRGEVLDIYDYIKLSNSLKQLLTKEN